MLCVVGMCKGGSKSYIILPMLFKVGRGLFAIGMKSWMKRWDVLAYPGPSLASPLPSWRVVTPFVGPDDGDSTANGPLTAVSGARPARDGSGSRQRHATERCHRTPAIGGLVDRLTAGGGL